MFVGHGVAAFALVGAVALHRGIDRQRALQLAFVAGLFATLPDVDILYGPFGFLNGVSGVFDAADAFWTTGNVVHRGPTHSMVLGVIAAGAFALWNAGHRGLAGAVLGAVSLVVATTSGSIAGAVTVAFVLGGLWIVERSHRWGFTPRDVFATALVGLVSHPLGDLFTGEPPSLLYPLDVSIVTERIVLSADPTIHLLGAFAIELTVLWLGLLVYTRLTDRRLRTYIGRKSAIGVGYAGTAVLLPAPTLEASYQFVFTVLGVGVVGVTQRDLFRRGVRAVDWLQALATGLAAVTMALLGYLLVYLLV